MAINKRVVFTRNKPKDTQTAKDNRTATSVVRLDMVPNPVGLTRASNAGDVATMAINSLYVAIEDWAMKTVPFQPRTQLNIAFYKLNMLMSVLMVFVAVFLFVTWEM